MPANVVYICLASFEKRMPKMASSKERTAAVEDMNEQNELNEQATVDLASAWPS